MTKPLALIVDDNVNNIRLIETYLTIFGYEYFSTTNPLEVQGIIDINTFSRLSAYQQLNNFKEV